MPLLPLLTLLIGCGCPDFSEIEVRDPDELITDKEVSWIEMAIARFGQWTGREGVCVGWVEVEEDLRSRGEPVAGICAGDHLRLDAGTQGLASTTAHELCHALENEEGHVAARPDLFTGEHDFNRKLYATDAERAEEGFARACERGPTDVLVGTWRDNLCRTTTVDPIENYLAEHVFTEAIGPFSWGALRSGSAWDARARDFGTWRTPALTQAALSRTVMALPEASFVVDLAVGTSELWVLLLLEVEGREGIGWVSVELDSGVVSAVQVIGTTAGMFVGASFSQGDVSGVGAEPVITVTELPDLTVLAFENQMYRIDGLTGATQALLPSQDDRWVGAAAVLDDTLYWVQAECLTCLDMPLWRRDLNDPDATPEIVANAPDADLLLPVAGGLVVPGSGGFWWGDLSGDAAGVTWEEHVLPAGLAVVGVTGPNGLLLQLEDEAIFLEFDLEHGEFTSIGDPCAPLPGEARWAGGPGELVGLGVGLDGSPELLRVAWER